MVVPVPGEADNSSSPVRGVMIPGATALSSTGDLSGSPVANSILKATSASAGISLIDSSTEKTKNTLGMGDSGVHNNSLESHLHNNHHDSSNSESSIIPASSKMDLEQGDKVGLGGRGAEGIINNRMKKYTYNPNDPDLPPHLSEYFERNVIAILNRCDPERGRRCYSCGYDNTVNIDQQMKQQQQQDAFGPGFNSGFRNSVGYEDEPYCWNSYNYGNNDYNNSSTGGMGYGYNNQYSGSNQQPQGGWNYYNDSYSAGNVGLYHNNYQHGNMSEGEIAMAISRRRYNSDGGNSDLDSGNAMEDEEVFTFDARLLSEAFLSSGRIDHTIQLMAYHPDYLEIFLKTHHFLMRGDGPLPYNHRNYIAIMAAARYQCSYLMELQKREFLYQGGDPKWLRGLEAAPAKLMALYNINKIMAHRPWVLKKEDFLHLTKKAGWSLSELVQAVVILAHFHSLSSFIHGCGITPEIDFDKGHSYMDPGNFNTFRSVSDALLGGEGGSVSTAGATAQSNNNKSATDNNTTSPSVSFAMDQPTSYFGTSGSNQDGGTGTDSTNSSDLLKGNKQTKSILKKTEVVSTTTANSSNNNTVTPSPSNNLLKSATHHNSLSGGASLVNGPPKKGLGSSASEVEIIMATMKNLSETSPIEDPEERKKRFENVASSDDSQEKENLLSHILKKGSSNIPPEISPFVCDPEFIYEDFAKRGQVSELHTFRIQDYSWEEHGFSLVNRLYTEVGVYLDEKFKVTQSMTYYTMGGRAHVDTTKFRTSVWNYIQCLYGIRHDDYDYGEVNQLLERPLKAYIKTICCYPERITKADYDNVMREFKHSEKVHVNLMIMEAKIQAELLYALRTIMRFMI